MKLSIRFKFTLIFVGIILGVIIAISLMNQSLLESYIISQKRSRLIELRKAVEEYVESGLTSENKQRIERGCRIANVQVIVFDGTQDGFGNILVSSDFFNVPGSFERLDIYERGGELEEARIYEQSDNYLLYKIFDGRMGNQLECVGSVYNSFYYILSTPLESISESVLLTNRFFSYVGIIAALVGGLIVFFVTGSLTRPIKQLAHLSEQMANQNFDVRYTGNRNDEIGHLGASMNDMSSNLKHVIEKLKAANEQLEKDIREKELIDERRREFVSNVSHELKTPIALVQGYAEGLREGVNDDPDSRSFYCDVIMDEAAKMNAIVHRLLNLGEIEAGFISLEKEDFNLTEMLNGVLHSASMLCGEKKVSFRLDAPEKLMVNADQFMIEEVMQNYISNACHHVGNPGEIVVRAYRFGNNGDDVITEVYNSGSCIPDEDLERIWDKFFKVDRSHSRKYGGSGIGLSIVKAIMDAHNGSCGARNQDEGVVFWFRLSPALQNQ